MINKEYCMSSYLAFRYIEKNDCDFKEGLKHKLSPITSQDKIVYINGSDDIDAEIGLTLNNKSTKKLGLLLSGGMDSAILASYMRGQNAYTFRFLNGDFMREELNRAEYYANKYELNLKYVDINWSVVDKNLDKLMISKGAPVHSIEPQLLEAAILAKKDGVEELVIGDASDYNFGGMDKLLSRDWTIDQFINRYVFLDPKLVLANHEDIRYVFERYRQENDKIDYLKFMEDVCNTESYGSYDNAFSVAEMPYIDPYCNLRMLKPLDLKRIRNGESKYLIRELFSKKYPEIPIPNKVPMPRPVDYYFKDWNGPTRSEFKSNLDMRMFDGNQRWQLYCLERFLNLIF